MFTLAPKRIGDRMEKQQHNKLPTESVSKKNELTPNWNMYRSMWSDVVLHDTYNIYRYLRSELHISSQQKSLKTLLCALRTKVGSKGDGSP